MTTITKSKRYEETRHGWADLDGRYGQIGISAEAAALRYQGDAKNPRYAPTEPLQATTEFEMDAAA
jgi:hypothetical protein